MTETKSATAAVESNGGQVSGYFSTYDRTPDAYGDIIAPGAFERTIAEWREKMAQGVYIPLLYGHSTEDPYYNIGRVVEVDDTEIGPFVTAEFDGDNEKAQYVRKLAQEGRLYQFSFAFEIVSASPDEVDGQKVRRIDEVNLFEVSLVQIPANQNAVVTEVKAADAKAGRRNSAKDEGDIAKIADLAREIIATTEALTSDGAGEPADEGKEREADEAEGADCQAELLSEYKAILKEIY